MTATVWASRAELDFESASVIGGRGFLLEDLLWSFDSLLSGCDSCDFDTMAGVISHGEL